MPWINNTHLPMIFCALIRIGRYPYPVGSAQGTPAVLNRSYVTDSLAVLLCEEGRCEEALAVFDRALEYFPDGCQLHFSRAVALEELDRADDALNGYGKCLAIEPDYADAHYNLARLKEP